MENIMIWNPEGQLPAEFFQIPHKVYRGDANYLGENKGQIQQQFSTANHFLIWVEKQVGTEVTRLCGFHSATMEIDGVPAAFFGFGKLLKICQRIKIF